MARPVKVTDLKNHATEIVARVEKGAEFVVTKRGRPVAVLLPVDLDDDDLADWVLAHHPEAVRRRQEAERRIAAGDYVTADDLRTLLRRTSTRRNRGR